MQDIEGGCEIFANGMRVGALGTMDSIQQEQSSLTFYDIPDSRIGLNGDVVIAIRFALNKTGRRRDHRHALDGDSVLLSSRDAAQRDASYVSAHQTAIPLILSGLGFVVGLVSLALYLVMRSRMEYMAIAISLLAQSFSWLK